MKKFLETITPLDHGILIPINRIKYIQKKYVSKAHCGYNWCITIVTDDGKFEEFFVNKENLNKRYLMIENLLNCST